MFCLKESLLEVIVPRSLREITSSSLDFSIEGFRKGDLEQVYSSVNMGRDWTICEPASHTASHANFIFKSKHPFQTALINCY